MARNDKTVTTSIMPVHFFLLQLTLFLRNKMQVFIAQAILAIHVGGI